MTKFTEVGVNGLECMEQVWKGTATFDSESVELLKTRSDVIGG